jgi:hypothetical protein
MTSIESAAQRYYFFAEREGAKVPDLPKDTAALTGWRKLVSRSIVSISCRNQPNESA